MQGSATDDTETRPPRRTAHAVLLAFAALLLLAAFCALPLDEPVAGAVRTFSHRVGKNHIIQDFLKIVRPLGQGDVLLLVALTLGACRARRRAGQILLSLLLVSVLVWPFKLGVGRERPNQSNTHSFPSGDAATVAAFCVPLVAASPWTAPVAAGAVVAVAAGRVYDGKHYPSDVLAGAALGIVAGVGALRILNRKRRWRLARRWMAGGIAVLLIAQMLTLLWSDAGPNVLVFLRMWGPPLAVLVVAWLAPVLLRTYGARIRRRMAAPVAQRRLLLASMGLVLVTYFFLTTRTTLWDRDEPRFARAAVEMVQSGNFLYPTFNDKLRPDKPILIYWLMSLPIRWLGPTELACRAVAPLATALACLLTGWLAARLFAPPVGLLAAVMLALSPLMLVSGTAATTDALLLAAILTAIAAFVLSFLNGFRPRYAVLLALALGTALLTKGPVGLALPLLVIVTVFVVARNQSALRWRDLGWLALAAGTGTALFLAWALPANAATGGEFLRKGLGHHVLDRTLQPMESHGGKSWLFGLYYLPIVAVAFFPWTLYLPAALRAAAGARLGAKGASAILLGWIVPVLVVMSLVATKLPHYVLPVWPALAILTAGAAYGLLENRSGAGANRWLRAGPWLFAPVGLAIGMAFLLVPWFLPLPDLRVPAFTAGLSVLILTGAATALFRRGRHAATLATLGAGMLVLVATMGLLLLPATERFKVSPQMARIINARTSPAVPVATRGYGEPSLTFYLGRGPVEALASNAEVLVWARRPGEGVLVISGKDLREANRLLRAAGARTLRALASVHGFNYSQGQWVEVLAARRAPADDNGSEQH